MMVRIRERIDMTKEILAKQGLRVDEESWSATADVISRSKLMMTTRKTKSMEHRLLLVEVVGFSVSSLAIRYSILCKIPVTSLPIFSNSSDSLSLQERENHVRITQK